MFKIGAVFGPCESTWVYIIERDLWNQTLYTNFSTKFFQTCCAYKHNGILPFSTIMSDLDHDLGSQGQHKAKLVGLISKHTIQLNWVNCDMML